MKKQVLFIFVLAIMIFTTISQLKADTPPPPPGGGSSDGVASDSSDGEGGGCLISLLRN